MKLKATSETARGVKILNSFCYGPVWATHEGGPYWRAHVWQSKPELWTAHAALTREIGAVEDLLRPAMPAPAKVALLHSSASDIWTVGGTNAFGFDRMHLWLAFAHAQMPVDIVAERQVARGMLDGYRVCHLTGPNLARAAAVKLREWVQNGGTLVLAAGAAERDEFNEPLNVLDDILPATRGTLEQLQTIQASGRYISSLAPKDEARWDDGRLDVLAVRQKLTPRAGAAITATLKDESPAIVCGTAGRGVVSCAAFLPGLAYIKPALDHRAALQKKVDEKTPLDAAEQAAAAKLDRSYNPWNFPGDVRDLILKPAREAGIEPPVRCSRALVDAVFMPGERGIVIPLANYTLEPIASIELKVAVPRRISRVESAVHGAVSFTQSSPDTVTFSLPLESNDFLQLIF